MRSFPWAGSAAYYLLPLSAGGPPVMEKTMEKTLELGTIPKFEYTGGWDLPFKYCPNPKCMVFQCEVTTRVTRCSLCGSEMQLVDITHD